MDKDLKATGGRGGVTRSRLQVPCSKSVECAGVCRESSGFRLRRAYGETSGPNRTGVVRDTETRFRPRYRWDGVAEFHVAGSTFQVGGTRRSLSRIERLPPSQSLRRDKWANPLHRRNYADGRPRRDDRTNCGPVAARGLTPTFHRRNGCAPASQSTRPDSRPAANPGPPRRARRDTHKRRHERR